MKLTNRRIKRILAGAPDGATHYDACSDEYVNYDDGQVYTEVGWVDVFIDAYADPSRLSDLRKILALRQRVQELEAQIAFTNSELAEHDAEVARKAVEEYKLSITEPNATVHRYPVVDLNGLYLPGADGRPMLLYGHIDNAESPSHQAFIKCVIGRLLEVLDDCDL